LYTSFARTGGSDIKAEYTAVIEAASEGGYWAWCPEVPGANGQGETVEEAKKNLNEAIDLIQFYNIMDLLDVC